MQSLAHRLSSGEILVGDGAWGTLLMDKGLAAGDAPERFSLSQPQILTELGSLYQTAGADLLTTNTFGATPLRLACYGLQEDTEKINRQAVAALRTIDPGKTYVSASMGPTGKLLKPYGDTDPEEIGASFQRQATALIEAGADAVCVETMIDIEEATLAVSAARAISRSIPIIATMTFDSTPRGFFTTMGVSVEAAASRLTDAGATVLGSNCGNGFDTLIDIAQAFRQVTDMPLAIQPNAGVPVYKSGQVVYPETPAFFEERCTRLLEVGVSIVGGCCGTTPEHIQALRRAVDEF